MKGTLEAKSRKMLKEAGLYCTKPRIAVLSVLLQTPGPLRQDQIAEAMTEKTLNKVTIYRTLESLVDAGLVHRAFMQKRAWHFELAHHCTEKQCHPHFACVGCGTTYCLTDIDLPMTKSPFKGFVINRQQVRLEGFCPDCSRRPDVPGDASGHLCNHCDKCPEQ